MIYALSSLLTNGIKTWIWLGTICNQFIMGKLQKEIKKSQDKKDDNLPSILLIFEILLVENSNFKTFWFMILKDTARNLDHLTNWLYTETIEFISRGKEEADLMAVYRPKEVKGNL